MNNTQPNLPLPLLLASVVARTAIVLVALVLGIRLFGKRGVGEMNLLDILMVLLIGNAVQNALTFGSGKLAVGLVSAAALLAADRLLGRLFVRVPWMQQKMFGDPVVILVDGEPDRKTMDREGIHEDEILEAARSVGLQDLQQIHLAVLEQNGEISIIAKEGQETDG